MIVTGPSTYLLVKVQACSQLFIVDVMLNNQVIVNIFPAGDRERAQQTHNTVARLLRPIRPLRILIAVHTISISFRVLVLLLRNHL